ncbi:uncharacterized protein K452DRAFT_307895 [Aplosporella prunicola CBS 121167]|uniref:F-box domain-containing protein n=1 Tax=Aplosporella prunicola CBS 121167 TaxID=1176127 RepID=A0A6A6BIE1_9PEZI|nr:uncharacterized protein K452DRAFT_307895 [Aplosporella prunicola CBS 121167]KAF2143014.1 hypothetical protein K452DRAFT_307895 [Aplosporella prunicola CBS 121167]
MPGFRFLDLPPELRIKVYQEYILSLNEDQPQRIWDDVDRKRPSRRWAEQKSFKQTCEPFQYKAIKDYKRNKLGGRCLLGTCRQIKTEFAEEIRRHTWSLFSGYLWPDLSLTTMPTWRAGVYYNTQFCGLSHPRNLMIYLSSCPFPRPIYQFLDYNKLPVSASHLGPLNTSLKNGVESLLRQYSGTENISIVLRVDVPISMILHGDTVERLFPVTSFFGLDIVDDSRCLRKLTRTVILEKDGITSKLCEHVCRFKDGAKFGECTEWRRDPHFWCTLVKNYNKDVYLDMYYDPFERRYHKKDEERNIDVMYADYEERKLRLAEAKAMSSCRLARLPVSPHVACFSIGFVSSSMGNAGSAESAPKPVSSDSKKP